MAGLRKILLFALGGIFVLLLLFMVVLLLHTSKSVAKLTVINDIKAYVVNFDESTGSPVEVMVDSKGFPPDLFATIDRSSFFPYGELDTKVIVGSYGCTGENRYILIDNWWKVFWIRIVKCGSEGKNYGPYKISGHDF